MVPFVPFFSFLFLFSTGAPLSPLFSFSFFFSFFFSFLNTWKNVTLRKENTTTRPKQPKIKTMNESTQS
jgi:hypothetical protein